MGTKKLILNQAIKSYNTDGVAKVNSRILAKDLGISHGNLEYHFPNKGALLKGIYKQMRSEISAAYSAIDETTDPLIQFNDLLLNLEIFHSKYSFFNLDIVEIKRSYPEVQALLNKTFLLRKEQMKHFYERFKEFGYFKDEPIPGMYQRLQHAIRILITFWKSQEEVLSYFNSNQERHMSVYIWELMLPNMTEKGLRMYSKLVVDKVVAI